MATGIVAHRRATPGHDVVTKTLTWVSVLAFIVLWLVTLGRIAFYPRECFGDLIDHARGVGFFTIAVGTAFPGSELVVILGNIAWRLFCGSWPHFCGRS